ncbi:hypothetical protein KUTeg_002053 [Tegillarca granosa]|uniref:Phospholipid scramblase n=1 Tax=Tegillarca granosa TaxID=220873 RepID=A0ABQ9FT89_TEGGR|nr:hypothetical protein KUTeg_002053 [Tegillarca granosa]
MNRPQSIPGCPPGLEYLTTLDQVIVKQHKDLLEAFVGWEQANRYRIFNNQSQQVFFAAEVPMDLDVKLKAAMIGAVFLIDFMYFEQNQNQGAY